VFRGVEEEGEIGARIGGRPATKEASAAGSTVVIVAVAAGKIWIGKTGETPAIVFPFCPERFVRDGYDMWAVLVIEGRG
jgi:hypothetical protein